MKFPYVVELPYSGSICSSQPLFFILICLKLLKCFSGQNSNMLKSPHRIQWSSCYRF